jgi:hypothetical protein
MDAAPPGELAGMTDGVAIFFAVALILSDAAAAS